MSAIFKDGP